MKFKQTLSRFSISLALCAAVGIASLAIASQEKSAAKSASDQSSADLLKVLESYIGGEWHCTGSWSTGEKLVAREVFTWSVGKKFVNVKTFVGAGAEEYQRYDAMYGVKDGKLMSWSFAYDGTTSTAEWNPSPQRIGGMQPEGRMPIATPADTWWTMLSRRSTTTL